MRVAAICATRVLFYDVQLHALGIGARHLGDCLHAAGCFKSPATATGRHHDHAFEDSVLPILPARSGV